MKPLCIALFLALFTARYSIQPQKPVLASNLGGNRTPTPASILIQARELLNRYGIRPYWQIPAFSPGEDVPADQAADVIAHLITCESQGVSVKHLDSNDRYSYGVLQIQSSTWAQFEASSGIEGDPMNATTAVSVGLWAVENGYLSKWSCAKILDLVR
jgi:hypothetical protein